MTTTHTMTELPAAAGLTARVARPFALLLLLATQRCGIRG